MKINIGLNDLKYRYDVYQMFNLYFPLDELKFNEEEDLDFEVTIKEEVITFKKGDFTFEEKIEENLKDSLKKCIFKSLKEITKDEYPWGTLVGIRPSKIALKGLEEGKSEEEIIKNFKDKHLASREKAELCIEVANFEKNFIKPKKGKIAIYVGMAFCPTRCLYCSFASNPIGGNKKLVTPYLEALTFEIKAIKDYIDKKGLEIESVYFGGGTPTAVSNEEFQSLMVSINDAFVKNRNLDEFTVECGRPDSITREKLLTMKEFNVTR
ncbi:MAG: radical SAM protein, partial [Clostridium sp.]